MSWRKEILDALHGVEFLSSPAMGALTALNNPDSKPEEISRMLEMDPALTAEILRFANSAYFGCARQIETVREAVVRLGFSTVTRMLLMSSTRKVAEKPVKGYDLGPGELWSSMISTAVGTELIAKELNLRAPPVAFTAGLLHNIGKIVLGTHLELDATVTCELAERENIPFDEAERRVIGVDYAEVGAELLRLWELPENLVNTVRWHLDPDQYDGDKKAVDLVHVANAFVMLSGCGLGADGLNYKLNEHAVERLGLDQDTIELTMCNLQDEVEKLTVPNGSE